MTKTDLTRFKKRFWSSKCNRLGNCRTRILIFRMRSANRVFMSKKPEEVSADLERRILLGLACEWESALWLLDPGQRKLMKKPFFRLDDSESRLGFWSGEKNEICLSRNLVLNHSWDSVRDVLLHEMAHQFSQQVLRSFNEPPHGDSFRRACRVLRADPRASGEYPPLDDRIADESGESGDRILVRIRKLMALAQSGNRHEAEAAMLKAHELVAKHNIDLISRNTRRDFVSIFIGKPALRRRREEYHLAHLVQDFYFVEGIWVSAFVVEKGKMGRVLEISGTSRNVRLADYVHDFVGRFIEARWSKYNRDKKLNRSRKTDFAVGIIEGFRTKLESSAEGKKFTQHELALVAARDPKLGEYFRYRYPRTTTFRRNVSSQDDNVLNDGIRVGKKLVIARGITDSGESGKLLPG